MSCFINGQIFERVHAQIHSMPFSKGSKYISQQEKEISQENRIIRSLNFYRPKSELRKTLCVATFVSSLKRFTVKHKHIVFILYFK